MKNLQSKKFALGKFFMLVFACVCLLSLSVGVVFAYVPSLRFSVSINQSLTSACVITHNNLNLFSTINGIKTANCVGQNQTFKVQPVASNVVEVKCTYSALTLNAEGEVEFEVDKLNDNDPKTYIANLQKVIAYGVEILPSSPFITVTPGTTLKIKFNSGVDLQPADEMIFYISLYNYTLLDFIQNTSTQYIDTGLKLVDFDTVEVEFLYPTLPSALNYIVGNRNSSTTAMSGVRINASNVITTYTGAEISSSVTLSANTAYCVKSYNIVGKQQIYVNGELKKSETNSTARSGTTTDYIFGVRQTSSPTPQYNAKIQLFSCKYSLNGNLVRNFFPCKNDQNEFGLFDAISGKFYQNSGTGSFTPGPEVSENCFCLPATYTQYDYIQSSGSQYINTGYVPNNNLKIDLTWYDVAHTGSNYLLGNRTTSSSGGTISFGGAQATLSLNCGAGGTSINLSDWTRNAEKKYRYVYEVKNSIFNIKAYDLTSNRTFDSDDVNYSNSINNGINLYLLAFHPDAKHKGARIYSCKIWDNGSLVRNFVPCKNDQNKIGLFDKVNGAFYKNSNTSGSDFTVGSVV